MNRRKFLKHSLSAGYTLCASMATVRYLVPTDEDLKKIPEPKEKYLNVKEISIPFECVFDEDFKTVECSIIVNGERHILEPFEDPGEIKI